jgi:hypothetical protein
MLLSLEAFKCNTTIEQKQVEYSKMPLPQLFDYEILHILNIHRCIQSVELITKDE